MLLYKTVTVTVTVTVIVTATVTITATVAAAAAITVSMYHCLCNGTVAITHWLWLGLECGGYDGTGYLGSGAHRPRAVGVCPEFCLFCWSLYPQERKEWDGRRKEARPRASRGGAEDITYIDASPIQQESSRKSRPARLSMDNWIRASANSSPLILP